MTCKCQKVSLETALTNNREVSEKTCPAFFFFNWDP